MEARVAAGGRWAGVLLIFLLLTIRLPFLNQAIQGDEHTYLAEGAHAQIEPLHPKHTTYVFGGREVDLRGHTHPPLDGWVLGALIAAFGDVEEIPFHAVYMVFSLIAAASMWSLARRFSPQPLWATLLFLAVPAFVVNGSSLEADVPFLAFWMASIALFCGGRLGLAAAAMVLAAMSAYQAVFLTPILAVWIIKGSRYAGGTACATPADELPVLVGQAVSPASRARWLTIFVAPAALLAWQLFERLSSGAFPAAMLAGYLTAYETLVAKLESAAALTIHAWFIVFPALLPPALVLAWCRRREPDTLFLLAWIAIFFGGAVVLFFAGSARYLLPMAAPVALLASRLPRKWLAAGFAAQLALGLALAAVNYQHWDAYRTFAASIRPATAAHRVWVNGEWGLRYYLESQGALPLTRTQRLRPGDIVVSSDLGRSASVTAPVTPIAAMEIRPAIPLRLIGLESHSGYSTSSRGLWPFGVSDGLIDRVSAVKVMERHPALEYLNMNAGEAPAQIVSGIYDLEAGSYRWMAKSAVVSLKSPAAPTPLRSTFRIPDQARARRVSLLLDGREVAFQTYARPGEYTLESPPVMPAGAEALVTITIDQTFSAPPDMRELGIVLTGVGFRR